MRLHNGIYRLWLLLSLIWMGAIVWRSDLSCSLKNGLGVTAPWCQFPLVDAQDYYSHLALRLFSAPIVAGIGILALAWVIEGFRRRR